MARELYSNFAQSTLATGIDAITTSLSVTTGDGAKFPSPAADQIFWAVLEEGTTREIVKVIARTTDTMTVVRAQQGTTALAFTAAAEIRLSVLQTIEGVARHVVLAAGKGPAASSPVSETSIQTVVIPGGTMSPGDVLRVTAIWRHAGTLTAPRISLDFGATAVQEVVVGGAADISLMMECFIAAYGATTQRAYGRVQRSNSTWLTPTFSEPAETLASDVTLDFRALFNGSTSDTIELVSYVVELMRA